MLSDIEKDRQLEQLLVPKQQQILRLKSSLVNMAKTRLESRTTHHWASTNKSWGSRECLLVVTTLVIIIQLLPTINNENKLAVLCQDFEDLNKQPAISNQTPLSRQPPQLQTSVTSSSSSSSLFSNSAGSNNTPKQLLQRPVLSSRFAPISNQQPQLEAQSSQSASVFTSPPQSGPAASQSSAPPTGNNVGQIMRNALARPPQLSAQTAESRQQSDQPPAPAPANSIGETSAVQSRFTSSSLSPSSQQTSTTNAADRAAEPSEAAAETQPASPDDSASTTTTSGHETVFSDQRFANLFARRGTAKKSRITPTEQVKAKPTLPSFIKSPPDPKQFTASHGGQDRPATPSSANFASARLQQQQNQNRLNLVNQQKNKAIITSTSAAAANNKRANSLNSKQTTSAPRASAPNPKANTATAKPVSPVSANNPFNRSPNNNNDPANVIALARKRFVANSALESGKLKQQQARPTE